MQTGRYCQEHVSPPASPYLHDARSSARYCTASRLLLTPSGEGALRRITSAKSLDLTPYTVLLQRLRSS